jgi:hypothetical protein
VTIDAGAGYLVRVDISSDFTLEDFYFDTLSFYNEGMVEIMQLRLLSVILTVDPK